MNRAVLSVLLAIMPALCLGAEDPKSPSAGTGLAFTPQAGAAAAMQMTGVLEFADGRYFLTDTTSKTRAQTRRGPGPWCQKLWGSGAVGDTGRDRARQAMVVFTLAPSGARTRA